MTARKLWPLALVIALVVLGAAFPNLAGLGDGGGDEGAAVQQSTDEIVGADATAARPHSNLPAISLDELPIEALDTLSLIESGGPFPFDRDDLIFQNRERLLPQHPRGHYREYTVITPGENDRGARRVVAGENGELYYTADHYSSFSEIAAEQQLE